MARNFSTQLAGQIGESLVVVELGRRGIVATAFSGNLPEIELLAYIGGKTLHLQVKAWRKGAVSLDARRFLKISMEARKQVVDGLVDELELGLLYVFVNIGETAGMDRYFVLDQGVLAVLVRDGYESFLAKHNGVRPRNAESTHNAVTLAQLQDYEDNWTLIEGHL